MAHYQTNPDLEVLYRYFLTRGSYIGNHGKVRPEHLLRNADMSAGNATKMLFGDDPKTAAAIVPDYGLIVVIHVLSVQYGGELFGTTLHSPLRWTIIKAGTMSVLLSWPVFKLFHREQKAIRRTKILIMMKSGYNIREENEERDTAADQMFASFEKEGRPVQKDVAAFEESIDTIFLVLDAFWTGHNIAVGGPQNTDSSKRSLYGRLLASVQESYADPVTGDPAEKTDALAAYADYEAWIARFEEKFNATSYKSMRQMKNDIRQAAKNLFASYEKDGTINQRAQQHPVILHQGMDLLLI